MEILEIKEIIEKTLDENKANNVISINLKKILLVLKILLLIFQILLNQTDFMSQKMPLLYIYLKVL